MYMLFVYPPLLVPISTNVIVRIAAKKRVVLYAKSIGKHISVFQKKICKYAIEKNCVQLKFLNLRVYPTQVGSATKLKRIKQSNRTRSIASDISILYI